MRTNQSVSADEDCRQARHKCNRNVGMYKDSMRGRQ